MEEITVEVMVEKSDMYEVLRMAQIAFARIGQDKNIYPKICEAWIRVSIALAKEAA